MKQGEIGLNLAQGKANEVLIEFENLASNIEKENSLAQQAMKNEGQRDEPKADSLKSLPSQMQKQINLVTQKMEDIKKLDFDVALEDNDEKIQSLHQKMDNQVKQTKMSLAKLESEISEKQKQKAKSGVLTEHQWEDQMSWVLKN